MKHATRALAGFIVILCGVFLGLQADSLKAADYESRRDRMVKEQIRARGVKNKQVLAAMRSVPRHLFVSPGQRHGAYTDRPLPIGHGQTISQPYIVAYMTELLKLEKGDKVLEVGTGSGYQAAVLAEIVEDVYTIEIIPDLAENAARHLKRAGYDKVRTKTGDGYYGWTEPSPFDAIVVTAAASHIPPPLVKQLKPGGRMVIPVGPVIRIQHLMLVIKKDDGEVVKHRKMPVRFVPLTGEH